MKRFICASLVLLMLLSATACGKAVSDTNVSASASEEFLIQRLGEIPENVVLGDKAVAAQYGIDMTDFEDDGYVLRTVGDSTIVFGKTDDGLDRAVRAYVKAAENGTADVLDEVYHEGYRVERLTIAGKDISEYTVYYPETANENMKFAASELVRLVNKATGVKLPIVVGEAVAPAFELRHTDDPSLENEGYRYEVTEDGVIIEGAVARGCMNGVWRFLQWELGWDQLNFGDSYLNEAEHIDIPVGTSRTENTVLELFKIYNPANTFISDRFSPNSAQNSYGTVSVAGHGLQNNKLMGENSFDKQPCFTDDEVYETCRSNVEKIISSRYGSPSFYEVDIGQYDTDQYCVCPECIKVFKEEGGHSGAVVRFANRLSEDLNETYPGLVYKIFAYSGTNEPPKVTVPNEFVYITFCFDRNCSNHPLDGNTCTDVIEVNGKNNSDYTEWLKGWCELTPNVYVWFYTLGTGLKSYTVVDNIYDDYRYFEEIGVRGIFYESEEYGEFSIKRVEHQLAAEMNWNHDMTREEYDALVCRLLEKEYGDGWEYILEYIKQWNTAQDLEGCWHCWEWRYDWFVAEKRFNTAFYREHFDYFVNLMELARAGANSAKQELRIDRLYASVLYMGCFSSYYHAYLCGDTERMEVLSDRYEKAISVARDYYGNLEEFPTIGTNYNYTVVYSPTIEEAAAGEWMDWFTEITGRPATEFSA